MLIISSTNRSNARDSHIADYYTTPISDVELFLKEFDKRIKLNWNKIKIVDCCAGGNHEIRDEYGIKEIYHPMSYQAAIHNVFGNCNVNNIEYRLGLKLQKRICMFPPRLIIIRSSTKLIYWLIIVASAAPAMPRLQPKIRIGSSAILSTAPDTIPIIA